MIKMIKDTKLLHRYKKGVQNTLKARKKYTAMSRVIVSSWNYEKCSPLFNLFCN